MRQFLLLRRWRGGYWRRLYHADKHAVAWFAQSPDYCVDEETTENVKEHEEELPHDGAHADVGHHHVGWTRELRTVLNTGTQFY